jgi:hypothetical protein
LKDLVASRVSLDERQPALSSMKKLPLILALVAPLAALAQTAPAPVPQKSRVIVSAANSAPENVDLQRFDLDFPGGTPGELVAAITKAQGQPLNAIIPIDQQSTKIMPIKVHAVTAPELFTAIQSASSSERPLITSNGPAGRSVQFRSIEMGFRPNTTPPTDQTVWSFYSTAPTPEYLAAISETQPAPAVCQYFQLGPYLEDHSIDDITTAIQTGWKMLKVDPPPQLSFHQETKLLIAVGVQQHIQQIPQVLDQLQRDDTPAVEKIAKWQAEIAGIEARKEPGWEKKKQENLDQIERVASVRRARERIQNSPPRPARIVQ